MSSARGLVWLGAIVAIAPLACTVDLPAILEPYEVADEDGESSDDAGDSEDEGLDAGEGGLLDFGGEAQSEAACRLVERTIDGPLPCELPAPSAAIDAVVEWSWMGPAGETSVVVTPLVVNFDDDDDSGEVDLCDGPDVIVIAVDLPPNKSAAWPHGHAYVLDGRTGAQTRRFETDLDASVTPAIGDLDGDGELELVAMQTADAVPLDQSVARRLVVFDRFGTIVATGEWSEPQPRGGAIALADLDNDGHAEILGPGVVASADASTRWWIDPVRPDSMPAAIDLDLDGRLEVLLGGNAYTAGGAEIFDAPGIPANAGSVAAANFDADPQPEIYVQHQSHRVLEHDGTLKTNCQGGSVTPVAVTDLDADQQAEILVSHNDSLRVLEVFGDDDDEKCKVDWSIKIDELDARASGTTFDLLADGLPEIIHADRSHLRIMSSDGLLIADLPRTARANSGNPIVADVDDDGAADIVVTSSEPVVGEGAMPATASVIVVRNADDRFAPARRVWNQHTYHGTNVMEDGTIPVFERPHWQVDKGFRTNELPDTASSDVCEAPPAP